MNPLRRLHRFLLSQAFYAVFLSSLLAMSIFSARVFASGTWRIYANLVWNLGLAWIPYLFSMLAIALHRLYPRRWWLLILPGSIWLAFFPNAAYIITDFLHLHERPGVPVWYDLLLLATFAWTGIFLAVASLRSMQLLVKTYLGDLMSWIFVAGTLSLGSLGIYLGRFERWNSWDLLFHSEHIMADVLGRFADPFSNLRFFGFTILITAFMLVCYLMFTSASLLRLEEGE